MDGGDINSAGIVTGIGRVDGRQVPLGAPLFHVEPAAEDDSATPSATG